MNEAVRASIGLPPLTFIDGAFLIDNSTLSLLKCPRLYQYQSLNKKVLADSKAGRNFGSTLHVGWATRYRRCGNRPVGPEDVLAINDAMREWLMENPQPPDDFRNLGHAERVMAFYNLNYQMEPFDILTSPHSDKPIVESSFALPIGTVEGVPLIYTGKLDLGTKDRNGTWAGPDHKTTFQYGASFDADMAMDGGQLGYTWALAQVLGERPRGYIIDGVRIRRPSSSKATKYIEAPAPVDASDFKRIPFDVSQDVLDEWREDVLELVALIFNFHRRGHFPRYRWQCVNKYGKCDFYDVCSIPRASREAVLTSTLYEENTWSPLNKAGE